jgi:hypothetical protein
VAKIRTNWSDIKQAIVDDIASFADNVVNNSLNDIKNRLIDKGLDKGKINISYGGKKVSMETNIEEEYQEGKLYFSQVEEEINDEDWLEKLL